MLHVQSMFRVAHLLKAILPCYLDLVKGNFLISLHEAQLTKKKYFGSLNGQDTSNSNLSTAYTDQSKGLQLC